jgi:hypothetical protein
MPKEIPILFSTQMVNAILEGRKTMTRRERGLKKVNENPDKWEMLGLDCSRGSVISSAACKSKVEDNNIAIKCPYGNVGDILYVRETWANLGHNNCQDGAEERNVIVFKASENGQDWENNTEGWRWKPGIHLPKSASRIWLEITDIGVERLQDISPNDAINEGIGSKYAGIPWYKNYRSFHQNEYAGLYDDLHDRQWISDPVLSFFSLWASINGANGVKGVHSFVDNPWVWVVKFRVLSTTGHFIGA